MCYCVLMGFSMQIPIHQVGGLEILWHSRGYGLSNGDRQDHEHDVLGQRINSPDWSTVETPQSVCLALSRQSLASTSIEDCPSWLPMRLPFSAPDSTLLAMMFGSNDGACPAE